MTISADFDIINYTKNSESSMKIASLTPLDTNKKIRQNRVRIQQNLKLKLNQHQKRDFFSENSSVETVLPLKTQRHIMILNRVGMVQKQYIQGQFQDSYYLKQKLGQGAHATVYRCIQKDSGKEFAVKITKHGDEELIQGARFQYKILKSLNHKNVMKAEAFYTDKVKLTTYLVCELCNYPELAFYLRNRNNKILEEAQATTIIASLLQTLQYLHKKRVCHRDIKPENILYNPQTKEIKLIDFDCSKNKRQSDSKFEMWTKTGSLYYQAPQYFQSAVYNQKVDLWAAGIIAYEMVTGEPPFKSVYYNRVIKMIIGEEASIENLNVSEEYKVLLKRLLQKDPQKRYSAQDCLRLSVILKAKHRHFVKIFDDFDIDISSATCSSPRSSPDTSVRSCEQSICGLHFHQPILKYYCFVDQF